MIKRVGVFITAGAVLLGASACGDATVSYMSIATAGTGGIYYPLGGALANMLSAADSGRRYTAEVTAGSVENVNRLRNGDVDIAMSIGTTIYEAYNGGTDFPEAHTALRVIAPLYPNVTNVLVRRSDVHGSVAALKGTRLSVGAPGSGTEQLARQLLDAYGLAIEDVQVQYLSFSESASALRDGAIDAAIISSGFPAPAVLEATTLGSAQLLPIDGDAAQKLVSGYPYYVASHIPAGSYKGVESDIPTVAVMNWIIASESLSDDVVTLILNTLRDQKDRLVQVHETARQLDLSLMRQSPIPLHPAAQRWLDAQPSIPR
jgi:hypothetical protein